MQVYTPSDEKQIGDVLASAAAHGRPLELVAGATKRALGRPVGAEDRLNISMLSGVSNYEAAELVLTAKAATPLVEIERMLAAQGQMLAFEPPCWRALLGGIGEPTLGGVLACNLAGPRRVRAGAARDFVLGFAAVNGSGEIWKAGGKVVKNVTGYDMSKLMVGAFGTLSVLTEVTLKVAPRPETECTLLVSALSDGDAVRRMADALNTPFEVSSTAHLPATIARRSCVGEVAVGTGAVTAFRLEGPAPSVAFRAQAITTSFGCAARLEQDVSRTFWAEVGEVASLLAPKGRIIWRLCPTPSQAAEVVSATRARIASAEAFYDWGGGLVWLSLDETEAGADAGAAVVRAALRPHGGHATLVVAPEATRRSVAVFEPLADALAALSARVKAGFDPANILNPGRMREGR